jgi:hypothetical protein
LINLDNDGTSQFTYPVNGAGGVPVPQQPPVGQMINSSAASGTSYHQRHRDSDMEFQYDQTGLQWFNQNQAAQ